MTMSTGDLPRRPADPERRRWRHCRKRGGRLARTNDLLPCAAVKRIPVVLFGLGAIGRSVARAAADDPGLRVVGAVDSDPAMAGTDLGRLWNARAGRGPTIVTALAGVRAAGRGRVLIQMTGSRLREVAPQIEAAIDAGYSVVSSCEELAWPWHRAPAVARRLDARARRRGVAVLGTGVNPGFVMDLLPVALSGMCRNVQRILCVRVVDAASRRLPLQRKIGAGMAPARFRALARADRIGHVGLAESARFIAAALGWRLTSLDCRIEPVIATRARGGELPIRPGRVAGLHQVAVGRVRAREVLRLDLTMAVGAPDPHDRIEVTATPPLRLVVEGGTPGDAATVAALLNGARAVAAAPPGLHTGLTLPIPSGRALPSPVRSRRS
jgi:hypothetical protein